MQNYSILSVRTKCCPKVELGKLQDFFVNSISWAHNYFVSPLAVFELQCKQKKPFGLQRPNLYLVLSEKVSCLLTVHQY